MFLSDLELLEVLALTSNKSNIEASIGIVAKSSKLGKDKNKNK